MIRSFARLATGGLTTAGGMYMGQQVQHHYGGQTYEGPAPEGGRRGDDMPIPEQYAREQQSNSAFPPGQHFMSFPPYAGGNVVGQMGVPQSVMNPLVSTFSDPSNPSAMANRNRLAVGIGATGALLMRRPHPASMLLGGGLLGLGSFLGGAEQVARSQGEAVTDRTGPSPEMRAMSTEQIGQRYGSLSASYDDMGYPAQASVSRALAHTPENLNVSTTLQDSLFGPR